MPPNDIETFYPKSQKEWREWLEENHDSKQSIWLVCYKKHANKPTIAWSNAVDEALCFGWIDSTRKSIDDDTFIQFFTRRKPKSNWSKINKEKTEKLIEAGLMQKAGFESITKAKENGSWTILDAVEDLTIPEDLEKEFAANPGSKDYFLSLSKSVKKIILHWVTMAKRPETRQNRMKEVAECAAQKRKPKHL